MVSVNYLGFFQVSADTILGAYAEGAQQSCETERETTRGKQRQGRKAERQAPGEQEFVAWEQTEHQI